MAKRNNGFLEKVLEEYGDDVLLRKREEAFPVISTGSLAIDVSTGIGGIPLGRVTEIYGPEGGGKTTICLQICRNALALGYKALYIDVENSLDLGYTSDILKKEYGTDEFIVVQPESGEDSIEIAEAGIASGFKLIVLDSIASLSPEKELEDPFVKDHVGLSPRLTAKFLRRQMSNINKKEVAMVVTNQIRANIGSYLQGDLTTPGGYALRHYTSLRIFLVQLGASSSIKDDNEKEVGRPIKFIIKKNKLSIPYRTATTNVIYGKGTDYTRDALAFATLLGVVKTRGSYYTFEEETIGLGMVKSIIALGENQELLDKIVKSCYNAIGMGLPLYGIGDVREEVSTEEIPENE